MALQTLSESVYAELCHKIGTPQVVAIRRDVLDVRELLINKTAKTYVQMYSGSNKEGFRYEDSDQDFMIWSNDHRVLWKSSQATLYILHEDKYSLILCDNSESPPGFTLLRSPLYAFPLKSHWAKLVLLSCVRISTERKDLYISSALYREITRPLIKPNSTVHGPCSSGRMDNLIDYDYAFCFVSDFWPPSASSWIGRCHSWPPPHVVDDIIRGGCHFVAIGHKFGEHPDDEWRISFSQAEQKLVYAMNHTQFLTYGLLKCFVKEFNNGLGEEEKLLCSYQMKTAIFWAVQQNTIAHWCPQNLLEGFWVCFKILLKWVYEGYCPNFFIPENNMFLGKVHGAAQWNLFTRLHGLYEKGIKCLLKSLSIRSCIIMDALHNPRLSVGTEEQSLISEVLIDRELFVEIYGKGAILLTNLNDCVEYLHTIEQFIGSPLTQYQILMIQTVTANTLQSSAFMLHDMYCKTNTPRCNKQVYIADKGSCYMLKLAAKFGCVSDLLYNAMYLYKTFRYHKALSVLELVKVMLAQPGLMYNYHVDKRYIDPERYTEAVGGYSWSYKMRHAVANNIILHKSICYINELQPEQQSSSQNSRFFLNIPLFIFLHMLEFLCYRHVDPKAAQEALGDLQVLVQHDQGVLVNRVLKDISWEILGICQHVEGKHQAALYSFVQSLKQNPLHNIHSVTILRILIMIYMKYNNKIMLNPLKL